MKYRVGQKFKIKTFEEVKRDAPEISWNHGFFDINAGKIFTIKEVNASNTRINGYTDSTDNIILYTNTGNELVLKNIIDIELDNNLFEL